MTAWLVSTVVGAMAVPHPLAVAQYAPSNILHQADYWEPPHVREANRERRRQESRRRIEEMRRQIEERERKEAEGE